MKANTDVPFTLEKDSVLTLEEVEDLLHKMGTVLLLEFYNLLNKADLPFRKESRHFPTAVDIAVARALIVQKSIDDATPFHVVQAQLNYVRHYVLNFLLEISHTDVSFIELLGTLSALHQKMREDEPALRKSFEKALVFMEAADDESFKDDDSDDIISLLKQFFEDE